MKTKIYIDKSTDKPLAFVLNLSINGLGVVRSLGRRGIPVIGLDPNPRQIGHFSRYCKGIVCPDPENEERYIDFLLTLGEQLNTKGVLMPTADSDVMAISKHRNKLEKYYILPLADFAVIEKLINKKKFYKILEDLNMPHPKTFSCKNISEVKQISSGINYPCIIKPIFSTYFNKEFGTKVFNVNCEKELINAYNKASSKGHEVVIQEMIPGSDTNMYLVSAYFNCLSQPLGIFSFKRIRQYPRIFGNGALCISVCSSEITELCTQLLKKIRYHGIIDAEFKRDPRDNTFKFIEINARTGMQHRLAARCGIDLPYIAYMDAIGQNIEQVGPQKEGIKWIHMLSDLRSSFESIFTGDLSVIEYIKSLKGEKEYAIFARDDLIPFFIFLSNLSSATLKYLIKNFLYKSRKVQHG
jgi:D-aspartate ligase